MFNVYLNIYWSLNELQALHFREGGDLDTQRNRKWVKEQKDIFLDFASWMINARVSHYEIYRNMGSVNRFSNDLISIIRQVKISILLSGGLFRLSFSNF